jgi:hypothetical protein
MKKLTFLLIAACLGYTAFSQVYTISALPNQVSLTQSERNYSGFFPTFCAGLSGDLYLAYIDYGAGGTTVIHQTAGGIIDDTLATNLPVSVTSLRLDANATLWLAGANYTTNPDSLIWTSSITPGSHFQYVPGAPHGAGGLSWSADVETMDFLNNVPFFSGRWDSAGGQLIHNVVRYAAGTFSDNPGYANVNATGYLTDDVFISKLSLTNYLTAYSPYSGRTLFNLTSTNASGIPLAISGNYPHADNVWYYHDVLYVAATDTTPGSHNQSILKSNQTGSYDTLAILNGGVTVRDIDTLGDQLLILVNGTATNLATGDTFFPVMSYNGGTLSPVIKYVTDTAAGSTPVLASIHGGVVHGTFSYINGISAINFFRLTYVDTTTPFDLITVTLIGSDTAYVARTHPYTDAGATAYGSVEGNLPVTIDMDNVNVNVVGTYYVRYRATDSVGNSAASPIRLVFVTPNTGIEEISPDAKIWASERSVMITGINGQGDVELYDLSGQKLYDLQFTDETRIDARRYAEGIYIVRVSQQGKETVQKISLY